MRALLVILGAMALLIGIATQPASAGKGSDIERFIKQLSKVATFDVFSPKARVWVLRTRPRPPIRAFRPEPEITTPPPSRRSDDVDHQLAVTPQSPRPDKVELPSADPPARLAAECGLALRCSS